MRWGGGEETLHRYCHYTTLEWEEDRVTSMPSCLTPPCSYMVSPTRWGTLSSREDMAVAGSRAWRYMTNSAVMADCTQQENTGTRGHKHSVSTRAPCQLPHSLFLEVGKRGAQSQRGMVRACCIEGDAPPPPSR